MKKKMIKHKKLQKKGHKKSDKSQISIRIKKKTLKQGGLALGALVLIVLVVIGLKNLELPTGGSSEQVKLDFYVMSQCPYGTQVEDGIAPVLEKLGDSVDFNLNFIATESADGSFTSLHGQTEVDGNIVQLCAIEHEPDKYMDMIVCMNKDARSIPANWVGCAGENDLNVNKIKTCFEGDEGKQLLSESVVETQAVGATGSPTIYLNDQPYAGGRSEADLFRALCSAFEEAPDACSDIPEPVEVNMIVLSDKRCTTCSGTVSRLVSQLKSLFPGLEVDYLDYMDTKGKKLYEDTGLDLLPVLLFEQGVEEGEGYSNIQRYLRAVGDYQILQIGADFNPTKEICDNEIDDNKNGKVDCEDSDCDGEFVCMQKRDVPLVELFVMSHCPYGTQTEKGFLPVVELMGEKIDFQVKFVDYAMHGKKELDEQTLQYCVQKEQNEKFIPYLKCFLEDENTDDCLAETDIDQDMLDACIAATDEEFKITELYEDESTWSGGRFPQFNIHKEENDRYGIGGSPSLAVNEVRVESFSRNAASLLEVVCVAFADKPAECDETLSSQQPSAGFGFEGAAPGAATTAGCGV